MLDFRDSTVFDSEKVKFNRFKNTKLSDLETEDERQQQLELEDGDSAIMDMDSFIGSEDSFDFGSMDDMDFDSGFGDSFGGSGSNRSDISNDQRYVQDKEWKTILFSPFYLVLYVSRLLIYSTPNKEEWKQIFQMLNKITTYSALGSIIFWAMDFKFIFSLPFQAFTSSIMFIISTLLIKYYFDKDSKEGEGDGEFGDFGDDFGGDFGDDFGFGGSEFTEGDVGGFGSGVDSEAMSMFGDMEDDDMFGETSGISDFEEFKKEDIKDGILAPSPIDISSNAMFDKTLLDVYRRNSVNQGTEFGGRKEILESLSDYIITNDKKFGSWNSIPKNSVEYNNLAYGIFKGLGQIANSFLNDDERFVVIEMKENPLMYRVEVELPAYFKSDMVQRKVSELEDSIKATDDDTDVEVFVSFFRGRFIFKLVRPNKNPISYGDILRFYDDTTKSTPLDDFDNYKLGLPILFGLRKMEYPYIVDLEDNTSGVIVGGSGSGKSWTTFLLMINLVTSNDYNDVNFIILDLKQSNFWNQFAKFPHVLGLHYNHKEYLELSREIYDEVTRRKQFLVDEGIENFKGIREKCRKEGDYEEIKRFPLLIIIVDEITSTMQSLKTYYGEDDKASYDEFRMNLSKLTQEGRSLGVRLIAIGQRSIDDSIPKNVMANASFKFGMKMDNEDDFKRMFSEKALNKVKKPTSIGMGLSTVNGSSEIDSIKTLTIGGSNDEQVTKYLRVLALEWVRRSIGIHDLYNQPEGMEFKLCYNRNIFLEKSFNEIEEGRILSHLKVDKGFSASEINQNMPTKSLSANQTYDDDDLDSILASSFDDDDDLDDLDSILDEYSDFDDDDDDFNIEDLIDSVFSETLDDDSDSSDSLISDNSLEDYGLDDEEEFDINSMLFDDDESEEDNSIPLVVDNVEDVEDDMEMDFNLFEDDVEDNDKDSSVSLFNSELYNEDVEDELSIFTDDSSNDSDSSLSIFDDEEDLNIFTNDSVSTKDDEDINLFKNDTEENLFKSDDDSFTTNNEKDDNEISIPKLDFNNLTNSKKDNNNVDKRKGDSEMNSNNNPYNLEENIIDEISKQKQPRRKPVKKRVIRRKVVKKKPINRQQTQQQVPNNSTQNNNALNVSFNNQSINSGRLAPKETVREYIMRKGQQVGANMYSIEKEVLITMYGENRVIEELELLSIVEDGDYFVTKI